MMVILIFMLIHEYSYALLVILPNYTLSPLLQVVSDYVDSNTNKWKGIREEIHFITQDDS
jgi:hypothetical protein